MVRTIGKASRINARLIPNSSRCEQDVAKIKWAKVLEKYRKWTRLNSLATMDHVMCNRYDNTPQPIRPVMNLGGLCFSFISTDS